MFDAMKPHAFRFNIHMPLCTALLDAGSMAIQSQRTAVQQCTPAGSAFCAGQCIGLGEQQRT